jgi:hypothetical protein
VGAAFAPGIGAPAGVSWRPRTDPGGTAPGLDKGGRKR